MQIVVGSKVGSKWMSDDLVKRAASTAKMMHIVMADTSFVDTSLACWDCAGQEFPTSTPNAVAMPAL